MSSHKQFAIAASAALCAIVLGQALTRAQAPQDPAERARNNARALEQNARTLTLFDRTGKVVTTIAERHIFNQPTLSPDAKRIALIKPDLDKETQEVWVYDIATGKGVQITSNKPREGVQSPAWSPDGRYVAYVALRGSRYTILRKLSDGSGAEETMYAHEGGPIVLTDWSLDARYLSFYTTDLSGSTLFLLPVEHGQLTLRRQRRHRKDDALAVATHAAKGAGIRLCRDRLWRLEQWPRLAELERPGSGFDLHRHDDAIGAEEEELLAVALPPDHSVPAVGRNLPLVDLRLRARRRH